MAIHWIVVASADRARILETEGLPGRAREVDELVEPRGRLKERDLREDRPGRYYDSNRTHKSHVGNVDTGWLHIREEFARRIAAYLADARMHGRFTRLELVAAPEFLGMLRKAIDPTTERMLHHEVAKDLVHENLRDLREHLARLAP